MRCVCAFELVRTMMLSSFLKLALLSLGLGRASGRVRPYEWIALSILPAKTAAVHVGGGGWSVVSCSIVSRVACLLVISRVRYQPISTAQAHRRKGAL
jgi:hypothetical protein